MMCRLAGLVLAVLVGHTFATPLPYRELDGRPLVVVSELGQRLASRSLLPEAERPGLTSRLEAPDVRLGLPSRLEAPETRLGLPSPQEIDAIKKVAQILIMLGEQVIPTIIGDIVPPPAPPAHAANCDVVPVEDVPNDPVNDN